VPQEGIKSFVVRDFFVPSPKATLRPAASSARMPTNKEEELELHAQSESYVITGITESWRENLHEWKTTMDGYRLFRKDRKGRRGGGVALYAKDKFERMMAS